MLRLTVTNLEITTGDHSRNNEGPGFDTIRDDCVLCASQRRYAFDFNNLSSGAADSRAHLVQQLSEIIYLWFAGGIVENSFAVGEGRSHHQVFSSRDGWLCERDLCRTQSSAVWCTRDYIAR